MIEEVPRAGSRVADGVALAGIIFAVAALLAASLLFFVEPSLVPLLWWAAFLLGLGSALISWLGLGMGTRHRQIALATLVLGSLTAVGAVVPFLGFLLAGGD